MAGCYFTPDFTDNPLITSINAQAGNFSDIGLPTPVSTELSYLNLKASNILFLPVVFEASVIDKLPYRNSNSKGSLIVDNQDIITAFTEVCTLKEWIIS